eukprot:GHVN01056161.1.p1 GENE.GHVN01056161.1~~GHVN01056161.1.p1  ORF type:complete len:630 (+),score=80.03 GHVN01056161.1:267-2156(+)
MLQVSPSGGRGLMRCNSKLRPHTKFGHTARETISTTQNSDSENESRDLIMKKRKPMHVGSPGTGITSKKKSRKQAALSWVPEYKIREVMGQGKHCLQKDTRIVVVDHQVERTPSIVAGLMERVYVCGEVWKLSPTVGVGYQLRYFALLEHDCCLAYWKLKPQYKDEQPQGGINLRAVTRIKVDGPDKLVLYLYPRDYVLKFRTPGEKDRWFDALSLHVHRAQQNQAEDEIGRTQFKGTLERHGLCSSKMLTYMTRMWEKIEDVSVERWPLTGSLDATRAFLKRRMVYPYLKAAWLAQGARLGEREDLQLYVPNFKRRNNHTNRAQVVTPELWINMKKVTTKGPHTLPPLNKVTQKGSMGKSRSSEGRVSVAFRNLAVCDADRVTSLLLTCNLAAEETPRHERFLDNVQVGLLYFQAPNIISTSFRPFVAMLISSRPVANGKYFQTRQRSLDPFPLPYGIELDKLYLFDPEMDDGPLFCINLASCADVKKISETKNGFEWAVVTRGGEEKVLAARTCREALGWRMCMITSRLEALPVKRRAAALPKLHHGNDQNLGCVWLPSDAVRSGYTNGAIFLNCRLPIGRRKRSKSVDHSSAMPVSARRRDPSDPLIRRVSDSLINYPCVGDKTGD